MGSEESRELKRVRKREENSSEETRERNLSGEQSGSGPELLSYQQERRGVKIQR